MDKYYINGAEYFFEDKINEINNIGNTILEIAKKFGYTEISTPYFENYEVYKNYDKLDKMNMTKIIDNDGKILVLRPDATIPITKFVSSKYEDKNEIIKLCYLTNIFREYKSPRNYGREFLQGGIEYFGVDTGEVDFELSKIAVEILKEIGFKDIQLDIGNIAYQESFFNNIDLSSKTKKRLKEIIETKNISDLEKFLSKLILNEEEKNTILAIPHLFGEYKTTIEKAKNLCKNSDMKKSLDRIEEIYELFQDWNKNIKIQLDLSFSNSLNYYSDFVFKIYTGSLHVPVASGGRYNNLAEDFGEKRPGCGLGINVNLIDEFINENNSDNIIHIALAKGRVHKQAMKRFEECGLIFPEYNEKSRKLLFLDKEKKIEVILVKSSDVPIYVENGAADLGIVGNDILLEDSYNVYELMNLNIGICRMATAKIKGDEIDYSRKLSIATKYPNITNKFFVEKGINCNLIKLNGSVELGPIVKLSDLIVDIVETGSTLIENNLVEDEKILDISSRVICNKVAIKTKTKQVDSILNILSELELKE